LRLGVSGNPRAQQDNSKPYLGARAALFQSKHLAIDLFFELRGSTPGIQNLPYNFCEFTLFPKMAQST